MKKHLKAKRKHTITNEQCKLIFDVSLRPYIGGSVYNGELNRVHMIPPSYVIIDEDEYVHVLTDISLNELYSMKEKKHILFDVNFFQQQARMMIMAKGDNHNNWTNTKLLDSFTSGMKKELARKLARLTQDD